MPCTGRGFRSVEGVLKTLNLFDVNLQWLEGLGKFDRILIDPPREGAHAISQALAQLQRMHSLKTGALVRAAVRMGALAADADQDTLARLDTFAAAFGLAFQVRDDLLDIEASSEQLGKTAGKDVAQAKATYPALLGLQGARARLDELAATMRDALAPLGSAAAHLAALGERAVHRSH